MKAENIKGKFEVIESFAIKKRNEFYMIGKIIQGEIEKNWFANIALNSSLSLTLRISKIEDIEFSSEKNIYKLIIISGDNETINNLLGLKIGNEYVNVTIEGED